MSHSNWLTSSFFRLLQKIDQELASRVKARHCLFCGAVLDVANYHRKPRGPTSMLPDGLLVLRLSLCCRADGCRRRHPPPSVLFLGRRVYLGLVVLLVPGKRRGDGVASLARVLDELSIDRRTLKRWRLWWQETVPLSGFWKAARARLFVYRHAGASPAQVLVGAFEADRTAQGLLNCLRYCSPLCCAMGTDWQDGVSPSESTHRMLMDL